MSAERIGKKCDKVKDPKRKAKYLINQLAARKGISYREYVEKYPTLGLQPQKAPKRKKSNKKSSDIHDIRVNAPIDLFAMRNLRNIINHHPDKNKYQTLNDAIKYALREADLWETKAELT